MLTTGHDLRTGQPLWGTLPHPRVPFAPLTADKKTDIVIVGAGITGAMAAEELTAAGWRVILIDRREPMKGATSATTALLQSEIDVPLTHLSKKIGPDDAARAWRRSRLALDSLASKIRTLGIRCGLREQCSLYLAGNILDAQALKEEWQARLRIGLHTHYLTRDQLAEHHSIHRNAALLSCNNYSVNPLQMAAGFLLKAIERGAQIYSPVTAETVEDGPDEVVVHTKGGHRITAQIILYATGYEIPKCIPSKRHKIHSTYAIVTKPQPGKLWPGRSLIWEAADPYLYLRATTDGRVLCGGEDEPFTDEDARDKLLPRKITKLEKKLGAIFPDLDNKAQFAWCGSFGTTDTGLPSIGAVPGMQRGYAILAFGGNGITFSRIAAELLRTTFAGQTDPEADLFAFQL